MSRLGWNTCLIVLVCHTRMEHKPGELSGGERQRVALARALVTKTCCCLADEPTGNLDRKNSIEYFELLTDLKKELNMAMLIVTHDEQLAQSADSILHMRDGLWINQNNLFCLISC